jgi:hypothetical protein
MPIADCYVLESGMNFIPHSAIVNRQFVDALDVPDAAQILVVGARRLLALDPAKECLTRR